MKKLSNKEKLNLVIIASSVICLLCVASSVYDILKNNNIKIENEKIKSVNEVVQEINVVAEEFKRKLPEELENENIIITAETQTLSDTGTLVRVKDGDTYVLNVNEKEITLRLIGVDTPESVAPENYVKENTDEGKEISEIVKEELREGDKLTLEYDVQTKDKYGRVLAYLYFEDGTMVQEWLLQNGYAQVMTIQPNCKYAERFVEEEQKAISKRIGIWEK